MHGFAQYRWLERTESEPVGNKQIFIKVRGMKYYWNENEVSYMNAKYKTFVEIVNKGSEVCTITFYDNRAT